MTQPVASILADTLANHGVDTIYCVPGESFLPLTNALRDRPQIQLVVCRHESGAGLMAVSHARVRGAPGVCLVSRGPGAMNAAIALHVAYHDADPVVFLIGQAERDELNRMALQEMNYSKTFSDTTKAVIEVIHPENIAEDTARAFHIAQSGTPGPVALILPEDLLYGEAKAEAAQPRRVVRPGMTADDTAVVLDLLRRAERPLVVAGNRLHGDGLADLQRLAETFQLPVAVPQRRFHAFDSRHPNAGGRLPNRANAGSLAIMKESDLILVIGERMLPSWTQNFQFPKAPVPDQTFVHVWPDATEVGRAYAPTLGIAADPHAFVQAMLAAGPGELPAGRKGWVERLNAQHREVMTYKTRSSNDGLVFGNVVAAIDRHMSPDAVVTCDAGNFSSWMAQFLNMGPGNMFVGAVVGAMGPGVPAAVGAGIAAPGRQVVAFVGDGGVLMTGNELATAVQYGVPVKIFISDNSAYGTIRMHQARSFPGRGYAIELKNPDFAKWGESFGAKGITIETEAEVEAKVAEAMAHDGPVVIHCRTSLDHISPNATISGIEEAARA
ncbi:MAG: acetolactate synthase [Alphaproteobacteria bacterium]|nr:acetolactate synthase [Alphaproteobacteria bacterium]MCB9929376.1 acetolactate synthase [Alphaproteobacteria bacterium]